MNKKVLIISTDSRKNGKSEALAEDEKGANGVVERDGHLDLKKPAKWEKQFKMKRKIFFVSACIVALTMLLSGCADRQDNNDLQSSESQSSEIHNTQKTKPSAESEPYVQQPEEKNSLEEDAVKKINLQIGNKNFTATLESNAAVDALVDMMREAPVVIQMSDYSGFEKVGPLGKGLPTCNSQTTTKSGDIVLYNGNQIVIFYGSNSWSYTRLEKIDDLSGLEDALGNGDVTVTLFILRDVQ